MIYSEFKKVVKQNFDKTALLYNNQQLSYGELDCRITLCAETINAENNMRHRRIIILLKNSDLFVYSFFAINKIGAVAVPLSFKMPVAQLAQYIDLVAPAAIICAIDRVEEISEIFNGLLFVANYQTHNIYVFKEEISFKKDIIELQYNQMDLAEILFTSGTTGTPKGIMLSNDNILENVKGINAYLDISETDRFLLIKPLHHSSTLNGEMLLGLLTGQTIVLTNKLVSPNTLYNLITVNQISVIFATPSLLRYLLEIENDKLHRLDKTLKIIHFYGAPLPENILNELIAKYPNVELIYSYGLTEASPRVTYIKKADLILKPLSSGIALYNVELKIFDENHLAELKAYEIGEICLKGKNIMKGYFNNQKLSEATISDGWLKTGDLGFLDAEGYLFHKGRKDDLIIKGAINIYPAEIENIVYELPAVQSVLVVGADSLEYGKKIIAYIEVKQGYSLSETDVSGHLLKKMEAIKCPDQIRFVDRLDLTESGKIKRLKH